MSDLRTDVAAVLSTFERSESSAREVWRALGDRGVQRRIHEQADVDIEALDGLLTELDARMPVGHTLSICVQAATVLPLMRQLRAAGPQSTRDFVAEVHDRLVRGEAVVAVAITDADRSGSDVLTSRTSVTLTEHGVVLNGGKEWITNATDCDYALVLAKHRPAAHFTSFCWVLLPMTTPGVFHRPGGEAFASGAVGHLRFADVRLDARHLVGRPGRALNDFATHIRTERLAGALWARAMCRRVLADTQRFLRNRPSAEGMLWDNAAVRERFARCLLEFHRLDAMCHRPSAPIDGMLLKAATGESVERILGECLRLRGASAFADHGVASLRTEAAMLGIAGGSDGAMLAGIADHAEDLLMVAG